MARESAFGRLNRHFHEHPQGRLHEFAFWAGLGLAVGGFALWGYLAGWMSTPFVLMTAVVGGCLFLWAFLPQRKPKPRALAKGKRGAIAEQVRASKAEKKRGKPPPPMGG